MAFQSYESSKRERKKSSILHQWTEESVRLFRLLSAKNWGETRLPKLTSFAKKLVSDKKITRAERMISKESKGWEGDVEPSGLGTLLTGGFLAEDIVVSPGGLTVFMFLPMEKSHDRTKLQRVQHFREVFGDGKLNESSLQAFADTKLYIPTDKNEATVQLNTAIKFLDLLTGRKSIASDGYRYGLQILQENGRKFVREVQRDRLFMIKYLYLLDCVFQSFCELLSTVAKGKDPLGKAHDRGLHIFMRKELDRELRSFLMLGSPPNLSLPQVLLPKRRGVNSEEGTRAPNAGPPKAAPIQAEPWMKTNPSPNPKWLIPEGKGFSDVFGKDTPENKRGFPKVVHHRTKKKIYPCLKYLCTGECPRGVSCNLSHCRAEHLSEEEVSKIDTRIEAIFPTP